MYLVYSIIFIVLIFILMSLWKEESWLRKGIAQGMASKYWILRERRRFVRFDEEMKIRYNLLHKPSDLKHTKTTNISGKGLCFLTYEKLKEKTNLDLEIELPGFSRPLKLIGEVVWIKELHTQDAQGRRLFYTGIRFFKIKPDVEAQLLTHLDTLSLPKDK